MITSRSMPFSVDVRSSRLVLPAGFSTDLSKSKNASAAKDTFSEIGAGAGTGMGAGIGAGAGSGWATGTTATLAATPSQPTTVALAGVQLPVCTQLPVPLRITLPRVS